MSILKDVVSGIIAPITKIITNKQEKDAAVESAKAKLRQAKQEGSHEVVLNEQEIEVVRTNSLKDSWKDEYVTISVVSILNLIVVGALLAAAGWPLVLQGMGGAVTLIAALGVDIGRMLEIVILAAVGVSVWRKL